MQASVGLSLADELFQISFGNFPPLSPIKVARRSSSAASPDGAAEPEAGRALAEENSRPVDAPAPAVAFPAAAFLPVPPRAVELTVSFGTFSPSPAKAARPTPTAAPVGTAAKDTAVFNDAVPVVSSACVSLLTSAAGVAVASALSAQPAAAEEEAANAAAEEADEATAVDTSAPKDIAGRVLVVAVDDETALSSEVAPGAEASVLAAPPLLAPAAASPPARRPLGRPERRGPGCGLGTFLAFVPCL